MATTSVVLSVVNNSPAVSCGNCKMRVKGLNTAGKAIYVESAQFELHFENVSPETSKLHVVSKASVVGTTGEATGKETNCDVEEATCETGEANDKADGARQAKLSKPRSVSSQALTQKCVTWCRSSTRRSKTLGTST